MRLRSIIARCALATSLLVPVANTSDALASPYARLIVVAESGADFSNTQLVDALASITDASPQSRYLVKLQPGTYPVTTTLQGKPYVDIEGSGEGVTIIEGIGVKVFELTENQEVRSLTFRESTGTSITSLVEARGAGSMRNVTIDGSHRSWHATLLVVRASARFDRVTARAVMNDWRWSSLGAVVYDGSPVFEHCTFVADSNNSGGTGWGQGFIIAARASSAPWTVTVNDSNIYGSRKGLIVAGCASCFLGDLYVRNSAISADPGYDAVDAYYPAARNHILHSTIAGRVYVAGTPMTKCVGTFTPTLESVTCP